MNARVALGLVVLWLLSLVWVYQFARGNEHNANEAAKVAPLVKSIATHNAAAVAGNVVERKAVRAEARQEAHTRTLLQEEHRHAQTNPAPVDCRLDDGGLRRWRAANRGAGADPAGTPDGAAAGDAAGPGQRSPGRLDGESHRDGRDLPPGAGALQGAGRVAGENP